MARRNLQTQREQRLVGMPAKAASIVSCPITAPAASSYAGFADVRPATGGHKWELNQLGASLQ